MAWVYLIIAGLFEIAWPMGLKLSADKDYRVLGITIAVVAMLISGALLWVAQKEIPIGTAYAVWTGIGAAGTMAAGIVFWNDPFTLWRVVGVMLIIGGVIVLKLAH